MGEVMVAIHGIQPSFLPPQINLLIVFHALILLV